MHLTKNRLFIILLSVLNVLLYACSSGSSDGDKLGGIDGSGSPVTSTSGTVSGFGSVIVNGVRYHTDKAKFLVDDQAGTEDDLHTGYQVHITGTLNSDGTGDAATIEFHSNIIGNITAINTETSQITLLGQTVRITNSTLFSANIMPNFIDGLTIGDTVQISGQTDGQGIITATRINKVSATSLKILGTIQNLDEANFTFTVNNLTVNYASANFSDVSGNHLQNGITVFVNGNLNNNGVLIAQTIKQLENTLHTGSKRGDVEGFITHFTSATEFNVADVSCMTDPQTIYENGTSASLALGAQLKIEGTVNSSGKLIASKIEFHKQESSIIVGNVTSVMANTNGAIVTGTLSVSGINIQTNQLTRVEDKSSTFLKRFNVGDIHVSDFVKISGYVTDSGFIATHIERADLQTDNTIRVEGVVTAVRADAFNMNDRSILVNDLTEFRGISSDIMTRADFLAAAVGKVVEVRGLLHEGSFTATRVQFKEDF